MKRLMLFLAGALMAVSVTACTPTKRPAETTAAQEQEHDHDHDHDHLQAPDGSVMESTVDGALEKQNMVVEDEDPAVMVCVYSVNKDKNGLKQNMDAIDGEEMDAQLLMDKLVELEVVSEDVVVDSFEYKNGVLTVDLSDFPEASDELVLTAISNTFIQNYEAEELNLSVEGSKVGDGPMTFVKEYKKIK